MVSSIAAGLMGAALFWALGAPLEGWWRVVQVCAVSCTIVFYVRSVHAGFDHD